MDSKRNRLKRKPKLSLVAQHSRDVVNPLHHSCDKPSEPSDDADVIIISDGEVSPSAVIATDPREKTFPSVQSASEARTKNKALSTLAEILLTLDKARKRTPLHLLPDLPAYKPIQKSSVAKANNAVTVLPNGTKADLLPLPKMCPCRLQHKKRKVRPACETSPLSVPQNDEKCMSELSSVSDETTASHVPVVPSTCVSNKKINTSVSSTETASIIVSSEQAANSSVERMKNTDTSNFKTESSETSTSSEKNSDISSEKREFSSTDRNQRMSAASKHRSDILSSSKATTSSSSLFSKFSAIPSISEDIDEFEELPRYKQHLTTSAKVSREESLTRRASFAGKRLSQTSMSADCPPKRRKTESCQAKDPSSSIPVTRSLFPARMKPTVSSSTAGPSNRSQPHISSFCTKSASVTNTSKTSVDSRLGNTLVCNSWDLQHDECQSSRPSGNHTVSNASAVHSVGYQTPNLDQTERGVGPAEKTKAAQGRRKQREGGSDSKGRNSGADHDSLVKSCPLCQIAFSTAMTQLDIDAHIAACLTVSEDDVVW